MKKKIALLDYGSGNLRSAYRALERVGVDVFLTHDPDVVLGADGLVVPGVGAFDACMKGLKAIHGDRLIDQRLAGGRPVLGICVGLQILFEQGNEHGVISSGCGQWPGKVEQLHADILPHMGWNTVDQAQGSVLFKDIGADERFYFVHSYGVREWNFHHEARTDAPLVSWAEHGGDRFIAAVENGALCATQFHPEKSGDVGAQLLKNWLDLV